MSRKGRSVWIVTPVLSALITASWPRNADVSSSCVKESDTLFTGRWRGKVAVELVRERIVTLKEGSLRRAVKIVLPIEPVA